MTGSAKETKEEKRKKEWLHVYVLFAGQREM